jgi:hypothetical protein
MVQILMNEKDTDDSWSEFHDAEMKVTLMKALYADNSKSEIKLCQAYTPFGILAVYILSLEITVCQCMYIL